MKFLRNIVEKAKVPFEKGGKLAKYHHLFETIDTLLFVPNDTAKLKGVQVRDAVDLKRFMMTVIISLLPALLFGMYNVGYQYYQAVGLEPTSAWDLWWVGIQRVVPVIIITYVFGLFITEFAFSVIRKHPINEGFLVSGILIPMVMPPTIPLWQVACASIFAVVIAKEAFGGTGMNVLNVALVARAFLYFAYPSDISGDQVWVYLGEQVAVDGFSGATPLALAASTLESGQNVVQTFAASTTDFSFANLFYGFVPGSIGETSVLMILIGAAILVFTGVGSWKVMISVFGGAYLMALLLSVAGANEYMLMPAHYHLVIGGLAFGAVFMATDPVTATQTETGKWIYGAMIGILTVIIRVLNPAYPEGIMLAILFMNVFAPLVDYYVVAANKKRRLKRATV
ncbi:MAG: NADH:ubiquinone reductase (Na(+)-transporting) subunit B [Cyclobacteriaceae bacterium]|nr:NADH:ubiquinone reductase (Na(+)-transporting) subunit B [Cyclobacteriaceae bacterium]